MYLGSHFGCPVQERHDKSCSDQEAGGHIGSIVRKQVETDGCAQLTFPFLI